jgi:hypothetical protein
MDPVLEIGVVMAASFFRRHPALAAVLWVLPIAVVLAFVGARDDDEFGHAAGHLMIALPVVAVLVSSRRWRELPPDRSGLVARRSMLIGLAFIGVGGFLEAVGAFGYEGNVRQYEAVARVHDVALALGPIGFVFLVIGGLLTLAPRLRVPRVARIALIVVGVAALVFAVSSLIGVRVGVG